MNRECCTLGFWGEKNEKNQNLFLRPASLRPSVPHFLFFFFFKSRTLNSFKLYVQKIKKGGQFCQKAFLTISNKK